MDTPCHPLREVAPAQRSLAGRALDPQDDRVPALNSDAAPDGQAVGGRVPRRREAARDTLPGRIVGAVATRRDRGRRCASTPAPEPVAGPRTAGSLPSRPERPVRHGRTGRGAEKRCRTSG